MSGIGTRLVFVVCAGLCLFGPGCAARRHRHRRPSAALVGPTCTEKEQSCAPGTELDEEPDTLPFDISLDDGDDGDDDEANTEVILERARPERARHRVFRQNPEAQSGASEHEERLQDADLFLHDEDKAEFVADTVGEISAPEKAGRGGISKKARLEIGPAGPGLVVGDWHMGVTVKMSTDDDFDNETNRLRMRRKQEDEAEAQRRGELPPPNPMEGLIAPRVLNSPDRTPGWAIIAGTRAALTQPRPAK